AVGGAHDEGVGGAVGQAGDAMLVGDGGGEIHRIGVVGGGRAGDVASVLPRRGVDVGGARRRRGGRVVDLVAHGAALVVRGVPAHDHGAVVRDGGLDAGAHGREARGAARGEAVAGGAPDGRGGVGVGGVPGRGAGVGR